MNKFKLIVEKNKEGFWGQVEEVPGVFSYGSTIDELKQNTQDAICLILEENIESNQDFDFELIMDIQEFFKSNEFINITSLASRIGMNPSLLRQYAKGIKYPSISQVAKIEIAIKQIGMQLMETKLQSA